jgi:hypothetical protein
MDSNETIYRGRSSAPTAMGSQRERTSLDVIGHGLGVGTPQISLDIVEYLSISELKAGGAQPPEAAKLACEAASALLGHDSVDPLEFLKKSPASKVAAVLRDFDAASLTPSRMKQVKAMINHWSIDDIKRTSIAAGQLAEWVVAAYTAGRVYEATLTNYAYLSSRLQDVPFRHLVRYQRPAGLTEVSFCWRGASEVPRLTA